MAPRLMEQGGTVDGAAAFAGVSLMVGRRPYPRSCFYARRQRVTGDVRVSDVAGFNGSGQKRLAAASKAALSVIIVFAGRQTPVTLSGFSPVAMKVIRPAHKLHWRWRGGGWAPHRLAGISMQHQLAVYFTCVCVCILCTKYAFC